MFDILLNHTGAKGASQNRSFSTLSTSPPGTHRFCFFASGSSSSSLISPYNVLGCVFFHALVNMGSFCALSAYLSNASLGSSSRIELSGMLFLICSSSGWLLRKALLLVCGVFVGPAICPKPSFLLDSVYRSSCCRPDL